MPTYNIYTDGACSQNGTWNGGWAYVITLAEQIVSEKSGGEQQTTNNKMELEAVKHSLCEIVSFLSFCGESRLDTVVNIYSDSAYFVNCIKDKWYINWEKNGWKTSKKEPVKNPDTWAAILYYVRYIEENCKEFNVIKVKAHTTDKWNNYVDRKAVEAKDEVGKL